MKQASRGFILKKRLEDMFYLAYGVNDLSHLVVLIIFETINVLMTVDASCRLLLLLVVMETGIPASTTNTCLINSINRMSGKKSKIPIYASNFKREYLFIRGLNKYFECFTKKLDSLNDGLFESNISNTIKKYMKRFLRSQEKGKFNNINKFIIPSYDIDNMLSNILLVNKDFENYKIRYDFFCKYRSDDYYNKDNEYFVDGKPYPGFKEFYDIFKMILNQINFNVYGNDYDCDSDMEEFDFPYTESDFEDFFTILESSFESD